MDLEDSNKSGSFEYETSYGTDDEPSVVHSPCGVVEEILPIPDRSKLPSDESIESCSEVNEAETTNQSQIDTASLRSSMHSNQSGSCENESSDDSRSSVENSPGSQTCIEVSDEEELLPILDTASQTPSIDQPIECYLDLEEAITPNQCDIDTVSQHTSVYGPYENDSSREYIDDISCLLRSPCRHNRIGDIDEERLLDTASELPLTDQPIESRLEVKEAAKTLKPSYIDAATQCSPMHNNTFDFCGYESPQYDADDESSMTNMVYSPCGQNSTEVVDDKLYSILDRSPIPLIDQPTDFYPEYNETKTPIQSPISTASLRSSMDSNKSGLLEYESSNGTDDKPSVVHSPGSQSCIEASDEEIILPCPVAEVEMIDSSPVLNWIEANNNEMIKLRTSVDVMKYDTLHVRKRIEPKMSRLSKCTPKPIAHLIMCKRRKTVFRRQKKRIALRSKATARDSSERKKKYKMKKPFGGQSSSE